jgi:hypothetical protein
MMTAELFLVLASTLERRSGRPPSVRDLVGAADWACGTLPTARGAG